MEINTIILLFWGVMLVIYLIQDFRLQKESQKLTDEILKLANDAIKRNEELINELIEINEILDNAEKTKENCWITLDKIKKELSE